MATSELLYRVGVPVVDDTLREIVGAFAEAFPERIRACYLVGSYANRSAVALSDLDIRLILSGDFRECALRLKTSTVSGENEQAIRLKTSSVSGENERAVR